MQRFVHSVVFQNELTIMVFIVLLIFIFIMNIFVAKLSADTTGDDLHELFSEFGEVTSAKVIFDKETGNSKRFGFVEMASESEGQEAIDQLNEKEFKNSKIVVKKALPKNDFQPRKNNFRGGRKNY